MSTALLLLQSISLEPAAWKLIELPIVGLIVWLWIRDQHSRERQQKASDARYEALVERVVTVVEANATTARGLTDAITARPCIRERR
jgi:membrane protein implicated in regulation of membrane protease activity